MALLHGSGPLAGNQFTSPRRFYSPRRIPPPLAPVFIPRPPQEVRSRKRRAIQTAQGNVAFVEVSEPSLPQTSPASTTGTVPAFKEDEPKDESQVSGANGDGKNGIAGVQGPPVPPPPVTAKVLNSRHQRRLGFGTQAQDTSEATSGNSFVSTSSIQPASRGPTTPTVPTSARQRQLKPQSSKPVVGSQGSKRDARPKAYVLDVPPAAPNYPNKQYSDFFPWKGNRIEDQVTDLQAKNAIIDRLPINLGKQTNEHQMSRLAVYPLLKQKTGLQTLSALFLSVLDKRQDYNRVTATSTFKPPPRWTLADQKRETWLRDLANPAVPLRKLSRTIPHGVRGKGLLDQCASKNIPPTRAIWFVRCVGANELRGLKRKGTSSVGFAGNEAKWIKEWTGQVIQFFEKAISECGTTPESVWKKRMVYAVRLSAQLYSEHLLDRTAFLDWYFSLLDMANIDTLPLSLLLAGIYWRDLLRVRCTGHRFAEALLGKAQMVLSGETGVYLPLLRRLSILVTKILIFHRDSLIMPRTWSRYRAALEACIDQSNPQIEACLQNVIQRNEILSLVSVPKKPEPVISPRRTVIDILDSASFPFDIDQLVKDCMSTMHDHINFIQCLCEWAVTSLRVGLYRVYLTAAILRQRARTGVSLHEPIMAFLERFSTAPGSKGKVYLLISELVRARKFSLQNYMRWLISRGILRPFTSMEKDHPCHVRLLAELPFAGATNNARNLRNSLLHGVGFSTALEAQCLSDAKRLVASRLGGLLSQDSPPPGPSCRFTLEELEFLHSLSRSQMTDIALWIKGSVRRHVVEGSPVGPNNWRDLTIEVGITAVTLQQFLLVRKLLEEFEDYGILADVLKAVSNSDNSALLSSIADTISYNIEIFSVLGCVDDILDLLYHRYKKLQLRRNIEKYVIQSLLDLASFNICDAEIRQQLEVDLAIYDQRHPTDMAHSPVSDNEFFAVIQDSAVDFNEEMDRILQNGSRIDIQTLYRLFDTIIMRTESTYGEQASYNRVYFVSLMKLRQLDPANFDDLLHNWVNRLFLSISRPKPLLQTFAVMITGSCMNLGTIVKSALRVLNDPFVMSRSASSELAAQVLELIAGVPVEDLLTDQEMYTLKRKRQIFVRNDPEVLIEVILRSIELCAAEGSFDLDNRIRGLIISKPIIHQLRSLSTSRPSLLMDHLLEPLSQYAQPALLKWLRLLIDHLLGDHDSSDLTDPDPDVQVSRLLQVANDFSIRLCKLKMRIIFDGQIGGSPNSHNSVTQTFFRGIASDFKQKAAIWDDLVSVLDENCIRQIRADAEDLFLQSMQFSIPLETNENSENIAKALLAVIDATGSEQRPVTGNGQGISTALVEKLNTLVHYMIPQQEEEGSPKAAEIVSSKELVAELRSWLVLFLRIVVLHRSSFSSASKIGISDQARMIIGLCALLQNEYLQGDELLFEHVIDVAGCFVDDLPEESRLAIRRFLRGKNVPPRVGYLLGNIDYPGDWLKATRAGKLMDFPVKSWELLADPTPGMGENDTSLSLTLFAARKAKCVRGEEAKGS